VQASDLSQRTDTLVKMEKKVDDSKVNLEINNVNRSSSLLIINETQFKRTKEKFRPIRLANI
jgi:hypothetical protein